MLDIDRIKSIVMLTGLNDEMLKKVTAKARIIKVKSGQYLFKDGDNAQNLYSVLEGKVVLEISQNSSMSFKTTDILPFHSFGISSLVDTEEKKCVSDARTTENSLLVVWKAEDLEALFKEDFKLGFLFAKRIGRILKNRLQIQNDLIATQLK